MEAKPRQRQRQTQAQIAADARAREQDRKQLLETATRLKNDPAFAGLPPLLSNEVWFRNVHRQEARYLGTRTTINPTDNRNAEGQIVEAIAEHQGWDTAGAGPRGHRRQVTSWWVARPPDPKVGRPPKEFDVQARVEAKKLEQTLKREAEARIAAAVRPQGPVGQGGVSNLAWECYCLTRPPAGIGLLSIEDAGAKLGLPKSKVQRRLDQVKQAFKYHKGGGYGPARNSDHTVRE